FMNRYTKIINMMGSYYTKDFEKEKKNVIKVREVKEDTVRKFFAAKVIPSPVPYADFVSSSTTKTFCGPRSGIVLCKAEHAKKL
ncbi:hypothetical protein ACTPEM_26190, partial [Clostridioides difficile]